MQPEILLAIATAFALVTGANDGAALLAPGLRLPAMGVFLSLGLLVSFLVTVPVILGTAVAATLLEGLVPARHNGLTALAVGFVVSVVVVATLTHAGRPTSLTLAVVGGIAGAGIGFGLPVDWSVLAKVLAIGLAAPIVGAAAGFVASYVWPARRETRFLSTVRRSHIIAYATQCLAYGANDGQKILVLFLAARVTIEDEPMLTWWMYLVAAVAFAAGTLLGLPRVARAVSSGILNSKPKQIVTAEMAAAAAVLGSAGLGAPVSMTQSIAGGLLGAGSHDSVRRVRWRTVRGLAAAWAFTLPVALGVSASAAVLVRSLGA